MTKHISVFLDEVLSVFASLKGSKRVLDATFGGGGHSVALLEAYPDIKIVGCDQDERSLHRAKEKYADFLIQNRLQLVHSNFADLKQRNFEPFDGVILDLGYSSIQLEDPSYGITFQKEGPLDMRLSQSTKQTAWDLLTKCTKQQIADILYNYGELKNSRKLARKIKESLKDGSLTNSTSSLSNLLRKNMPPSKTIHPATLGFQALRIAVNDELRVLDRFLHDAMLLLNKGGILAIITFHSLEDRIVKQWGKKTDHFKEWSESPMQPSEKEVKDNPRSRSAKLRIYWRI
ncbi:MAG: 16S rRNA (cytosine(1402)-N(4))-methyltransferase RsmH [Bacteriovoracia bacterium]